MSAKIIVSYDGTENDHDALALGRVFAEAGASVELAYVRHTTESERRREELEQDEAEQLLARGAQWLGQPDASRHVVLSGSTPEGLRQLAREQGADVIVFGSDAHTAPGRVEPQQSAQRLLEGGPVAVAIAPARLRDRSDLRIESVGVLDENGHTDPSAAETARSLASALGATVAQSDDGVDLLVVSSRPEAAQGQVVVSATAAYRVENASAPVLVVPRGTTVEFGAPVAAVATS